MATERIVMSTSCWPLLELRVVRLAASLLSVTCLSGGTITVQSTVSVWNIISILLSQLYTVIEMVIELKTCSV